MGMLLRAAIILACCLPLWGYSVQADHQVAQPLSLPQGVSNLAESSLNVPEPVLAIILMVFALSVLSWVYHHKKRKR